QELQPTTTMSRATTSLQPSQLRPPPCAPAAIVAGSTAWTVACDVEKRGSLLPPGNPITKPKRTTPLPSRATQTLGKASPATSRRIAPPLTGFGEFLKLFGHLPIKILTFL
ncbi:hypothetical protein TorRG33x02_042720, partial [Trema orientale]